MPCPASLDLPHALVEWATMLIVTREGDRRCKLPLHQRALVECDRVGDSRADYFAKHRRHGVNVPVLVGRACTGAGPHVTTGLKQPPGGELAPTRRTLNRALAQARAPVERAMAQLKSWQVSRRSRIGPNRTAVIAKAVLTLERQR
ncbi:hypothetical protein SUDANB176_00217 [Streptomyces sp. enrichment culture]